MSSIEQARKKLPEYLQSKWNPEEDVLFEGQRGLDTETEGLLNAALSRSLEPSESIAKDLMSGVQDYSPYDSAAESNRNKSLAISDPLTTSALEKRAQRKHSGFLDDLKTDVDFQSKLKKADRLDQTSNLLAKAHSLRLQNWKQKQLAIEQAVALREQREAQRSSFLKDLLGVAGGIVGTLVAGPVGAAVGSGAASGVDAAAAGLTEGAV